MLKLLTSLAFASSALAASCPPGTDLQATYDASSNTASLSNGYVCVQVARGTIVHASADFDGQGNYGNNVFAPSGLTLQREDADGTVHSSAEAVNNVHINVHKQSDARASVLMTGIRDSDKFPLVEESWSIGLSAKSRSFDLHIEGSIVNDGSAKSVRRNWEMNPASIYAWYKTGVTQMKGANAGANYYVSRDPLVRVYGLGGNDTENAANWAFDIIPQYHSDIQTVLLNRNDGNPYWSGFQEVLVNGVTDKKILDHWTNGWATQSAQTVKKGTSWTHDLTVGINNLDFPVAKLSTEPNLPRNDLHSIMSGIYASPVGCLCTHANEVDDGVQVAQIATTPARPDRGYQDTYNFFDPDNYFSTTAMVWSNEPYLQDQVRQVLERSGSFLKDDGQLPHHFVKTEPVYQALSGEIQTGPNVFWILSCFNYAKATQNLDWLKGYMPKIRLASNFLFSLIDPNVNLANVPGSLMIDVFLRSNFTSDTNAQLVGFFREFADAEEAIGNSTGASDLRKLATTISEAMNKYLWSPSDSDHYVTQWNGPKDNTYRDFIDYDANLIATAHGIPDADRAAKIFARIDNGKCRTTATWVSEIYYGPNDTTNGNTGDSACAMARIAWFDSLSRKRYNALDSFDNYIMNPLQKIILSTTWMHERLACDGTQQLFRTNMYFEYPSAISMLVRNIRYGIELGFNKLTIDPFGAKDFAYHFGNLDLTYSDYQVTVHSSIFSGRNIEFGINHLTPNAQYAVDSSCGTSPVVLLGRSAVVSTDANGLLQLSYEFAADQDCTLIITRK